MSSYRAGKLKYEPETQTIRATPENFMIAAIAPYDAAVDHEYHVRLFTDAPTLRDVLIDALLDSGYAVTAPIPQNIRYSVPAWVYKARAILASIAGTPVDRRDKMIAWLVACDAAIEDDEPLFPWVVDRVTGDYRGYDSMTDDELAELYAHHEGPPLES